MLCGFRFLLQLVPNCHSRLILVIPASEPDILQGECRDRLLADCHDRAAEDGAKAQSPLLTNDH